MCHAYNRKCEKIAEGVEIPNQERIRMIGEKKITSTFEH